MRWYGKLLAKCLECSKCSVVVFCWLVGFILFVFKQNQDHIREVLPACLRESPYHPNSISLKLMNITSHIIVLKSYPFSPSSSSPSPQSLFLVNLTDMCLHTKLLKISKILKGFPFIVHATLIIIRASNAYQKFVFLKNNRSSPQRESDTQGFC